MDYEPYHETVSHIKEKSTDKLVESLRKQISDLGKKYNSLKNECDKVTQLLCYSCGTFLTKEHVPVDHRLVEWWEKHCDWDNRRTLDTFKKMWGSNPDQIPTREVVYKWFVDSADKVHPLSEYHRIDFFDYIWSEFLNWHNNRKNRADRISELEAELAMLKSKN